jgi:SpoVK/Ycf46/Vps4 family AAA+-type ATPase
LTITLAKSERFTSVIHFAKATLRFPSLAFSSNPKSAATWPNPEIPPARTAAPNRSISPRINTCVGPIAEFDTTELIEATNGFSGADLKWVFDRAAELALSAAIHTGQPVPITLELLLAVAKAHSPSTQEWFEGVRTHAQSQEGPNSIFNDMRKFLNAPSNTKKER